MSPEVLNATHAVYGVKGMTAIPMVEQRARIVINTLASSHTQASRPSLLVGSGTLDSISRLPTDEEASQSVDAARSPPRVQFSPHDDVKVISPLASSFGLNVDSEEQGTLSPYASSSDLSSPASEYSITTSPVAKTLASRLFGTESLNGLRSPPRHPHR
jgi:hypothetical protein